MPESSTRTVERALSLLAVVCERGAANLADTARVCELPASTALRLLRTLEASGFVRKDDGGVYHPGSRIIQLGAAALSNDSLATLCRPSMQELALATGESVYLSIEGPGETAVYIGIVEGTHSVRHTSWVGRTIPLATTAVGAVLTGADAPDGFVVADRAVESDVTAVACPIRSQDRVVAALSLVVPSYRMTGEITRRHGRLLVGAAADLSAGLSSPDRPAGHEGRG